VEVVTRILALFNALFVVLLAACAGPIDDAPSLTASGPDNAAGLTPAAREVSQIADRNGDHDYLMLDKAHGRIIMFENGRPTFTGAALTGENPADFLEPDAFSKTFAEQKGLKYKVTPAGRYTVSIGYDNSYGETLDVNEVQGKDWDIAIHKVWLGAPSEHRDARLRSPAFTDKHITYGCIDVDGPTMSQLLQRIPDDEKTPLYILPQDDRLIGQVFHPRQAGSQTGQQTARNGT
jgi:hypothetical protein